jgi:signal transduction histidine kinase
MVPPTENSTNESAPGQRLPSEEETLARAVVLICEPDAALQTSIVDLLRSAGFATVIGAADFEDAAAQCSASPPDVALFRVTNDDTPGAFVEALRALNSGRPLSVVHLYAGTDPRRGKAPFTPGDDALSLDHDLEALPNRVLTVATLRLMEQALISQRAAMDEIIEKRTERLNKALDLLRAAETRLRSELSDAKSENRNRIDYFAETQHELRTPLNAICGMSDAMRNEMFGALENPKYKEYADNIFQSGQHLLAIIDGRLELSRIEAGADPLEIERVDVGGIIQETTEMLGRIAEKANVALEVDVAPDLPVIETDRLKLRQVLVNLVSNAIKFTPEKGRVLVSVKRNAKKGVLILVVSDTGIGMSANDVRDAMKPYHRLSGDRRSGERGSGLGLTIVRKLVETLGATIEIQSTPGKGTSVKIELPMSAAADEQPLSAAG